MSTYTYKLLGALLGVLAGVALMIIGALLGTGPDDGTGGVTLMVTGSALIGAASTAIYTNGRKGPDQP